MPSETVTRILRNQHHMSDEDIDVMSEPDAKAKISDEDFLRDAITELRLNHRAPAESMVVQAIIQRVFGETRSKAPYRSKLKEVLDDHKGDPDAGIFCGVGVDGLLSVIEAIELNLVWQNKKRLTRVTRRRRNPQSPPQDQVVGRKRRL